MLGSGTADVHIRTRLPAAGTIWGSGLTRGVEYDALENGFHAIVAFQDPGEGSAGRGTTRNTLAAVSVR